MKLIPILFLALTFYSCKNKVYKSSDTGYESTENFIQADGNVFSVELIGMGLTREHFVDEKFNGLTYCNTDKISICNDKKTGHTFHILNSKIFKPKFDYYIIATKSNDPNVFDVDIKIQKKVNGKFKTIINAGTFKIYNGMRSVDQMLQEMIDIIVKLTFK